MWRNRRGDAVSPRAQEIIVAYEGLAASSAGVVLGGRQQNRSKCKSYRLWLSGAAIGALLVVPSGADASCVAALEASILCSGVSSSEISDAAYLAYLPELSPAHEARQTDPANDGIDQGAGASQSGRELVKALDVPFAAVSESTVSAAADASLSVHADVDRGLGSEIGQSENAGGRGQAIEIIKPSDIEIVSLGDRSTTADDTPTIAARSAGDVSIDSTGDLSTAGDRSEGIAAIADGAVTVESRGDISTGGDNASGILADGGSDTVSVTSTGDIATAGDNSTGITAFGDTAVVVESRGDIATEGDNADAIVADGGSGTASVVSVGDIETGGERTSGISAYGDAGVDVSSEGDITSSGENAAGILALGGDGDVTVTSVGDLDSTGDGATGISAYADGEVSVDAGGEINADGDNAAAILVDSTAGTVTVESSGDLNATGDGSSGIAVSSGETVTVTTVSAITSDGDDSSAIRAEAGDGIATVVTTGDLSAAGTNATGILATSDEEVVVSSRSNIDASGDQSAAIFAEVSAGDVSVASSGDITAVGDDAAGIVALGELDATVTTRGDISVDGDGSAAIVAEAIAGDVSVDSSGELAANGEGATGIYVTGDGAVGISSSGDIATMGDNSAGIDADGGSGSVDITASGDMVSSGDSSLGIVARGDTVDISLSGDITAMGFESAGILIAESNDANISIDGGTITSGDDGAGVVFASEGNNQLDNGGTIDAGQGVAIVGGAGDESISNDGTVIGSISLGDGDNAFVNSASGVLEAGSTVDLGGGTLENSGTLSPGGDGTYTTTKIEGSLVQSQGGTLAINADAASGVSDALIVSETATLNGTVAVTLTDLASTAQDIMLVSAEGGIVNQGLTVADTAAVDFSLSHDATNVYLSVAVDYTPDEASANQAQVAKSLNSALEAGATEQMKPLLTTLANMPASASYSAAIQQLLPASETGASGNLVANSGSFARALLSCRVAEGPSAIIREGQCVWARYGARTFSRDASAGDPRLDGHGNTFAAGAQVALDPVWRLGAAIGYDDASTSAQGGGSTDSGMVDVGAVVKYNPGPWLAAVSINGAFGELKSTRPVPLLGAVARSDREADSLNGKLHLAYLYEGPQLYLKPMLDVSATYTQLGAAREQGANGANLVFAETDDVVLGVSPALEAGFEMRDTSGLVYRPYVRAGITFYGDNDIHQTIFFADAAAGAEAFTIVSAVDDIFLDVGAGIDIVTSGDSALRLQYDGRFSDATETHAGGIKASLKF